MLYTRDIPNTKYLEKLRIRKWKVTVKQTDITHWENIYHKILWNRLKENSIEKWTRNLTRYYQRPHLFINTQKGSLPHH